MPVTIVAPPAKQATLSTPLMTEHNLADYPELQDFFGRAFHLDTVGLSQPGCVCVDPGERYLLVFLGRSGESFPSGVEIHPVTTAVGRSGTERAARDLSAILQWIIEQSQADAPRPVRSSHKLTAAR